MPGISFQHDSPSFVYSQTRNLPLETWQEIFWLASHIKDADEFITNVGGYNPTVWDGGNVAKAEIAPGEMSVALQTRQNITLVCKAWYAMGIKILYSHVRMPSRLWDDRARLRQFVDTPQLSHTKRLTIEPDYGLYIRLIPAERMDWMASLCVSLPRLRILDAPGTVFLSMPNQRLSSSLTVAIFRGPNDMRFDAPLYFPLPGPWCNIRILNIDLHSLGPPRKHIRGHFGKMNFASVEELYFYKGHPRTSTAVPEFVFEQLRFPKLHALSICHLQWIPWRGFLEAHSQTLEVLSLTTYGKLFSPTYKEINLPALECFHLDKYDINLNIVAGKMTHVGLHRVGCDGDPNREVTEDNKAESLRHLLLTFDYWLHFPAATTYHITGWHEILEWLEEQPEVIRRVTSHKTHGVDVKFIHMDKHSYR